jgi:four helix bundle protein
MARVSIWRIASFGCGVGMQDCGTAASPNCAEAQAGESRKDFVHKMRLCLKELRETLVWFKLSHRLGIGDPGMLKEGIAESDELVRIFVTSIATAKRNDNTRS